LRMSRSKHTLFSHVLINFFPSMMSKAGAIRAFTAS
jgi:hypothetical protein